LQSDWHFWPIRALGILGFRCPIANIASAIIWGCRLLTSLLAVLVIIVTAWPAATIRATARLIVLADWSLPASRL